MCLTAQEKIRIRIKNKTAGHAGIACFSFALKGNRAGSPHFKIVRFKWWEHVTSGWRVNSNKEAGDGFSDILIRIDDSDVGIVIEVKYSENDTGDIECRKAITQIDQKKYADELRDNGIGTIWKYGIVCNKKKCRVYDATYEKA